MNYYEGRLYVTTYQSGGEGQIDTQTYVRTDIQTEKYDRKYSRPMGIDTTNEIRLGFSRRRIQLEF